VGADQQHATAERVHAVSPDRIVQLDAVDRLRRQRKVDREQQRAGLAEALEQDGPRLGGRAHADSGRFVGRNARTAWPSLMKTPKIRPGTAYAKRAR